MKTALCTISSKSHLFKVNTLFSSLVSFFDGDLFCLVTDITKVVKQNIGIFENLKQLDISNLNEIIQKYKGDELRWLLKPIYLKYLLDRGYKRVIYVDNDIYFFQSPTLLFERLNKSSILLTPHFYPSNPKNNQNWFEANFRVGLYNAGFIGVNQNAAQMLDWWRDCCLYNVKKSFWRGLFDDQKYLDLVPVIFDHVEIVKDSGCNLAGWNFENRLKQLKKPDLETVTFVHFAELSIKEFSKIDSPFNPLFKVYENQILKWNNNFNFTNSNFSKRKIIAYIYYLRWKFVRLFEKRTS